MVGSVEWETVENFDVPSADITSILRGSEKWRVERRPDADDILETSGA